MLKSARVTAAYISQPPAPQIGIGLVQAFIDGLFVVHWQTPALVHELAPAPQLLHAAPSAPHEVADRVVQVLPVQQPVQPVPGPQVQMRVPPLHS